MNIFIVEKCSNFTDGHGPMLVDRIFENLEDARNYVMQCDGIFGSIQCMSNSRRLDNGLLHEYWNGYDISEYQVVPKQPEPEKKWGFRYKVFYPSDDKERLFKFVSEIENDEKYLNPELAKFAADEILKTSNFQLHSSQKWQKHTDSNGEEIYAKNVYVIDGCTDKDEELFYQFQVYEMK